MRESKARRDDTAPPTLRLTDRHSQHSPLIDTHIGRIDTRVRAFAMTFVVPLTMYQACGKCGHTWPSGGTSSQLIVTTHDLAQAMVRNAVARLLGQPKRRTPRQERRLLAASLLRVRALIRRSRRGSLTGHRVMDAHHGSARRHLSEDFGIAIAMSFAEKTLACRAHYFLDANPNAKQFGFPERKRPDIGSVTTTGTWILTEAKGSMRRKRLAPQPGKTDPAKLIKNGYLQLTGNHQATHPATTRLFLTVTSPIIAQRTVRLDTAEYAMTPTRPCPICGFDGTNYDDVQDSTSLRRFEPDWERLALETYRRLSQLLSDEQTEPDDAEQYRVFELDNADVTIGLHRRIATAVSRPDTSARDLQRALDRLPPALIEPDNGRYADGTLTQTNWPETQPDHQDEDEQQGDDEDDD